MPVTLDRHRVDGRFGAGVAIRRLLTLRSGKEESMGANKNQFSYSFCPPYSNAVSSVEEKFQAAS